MRQDKQFKIETNYLGVQNAHSDTMTTPDDRSNDLMRDLITDILDMRYEDQCFIRAVMSGDLSKVQQLFKPTAAGYVPEMDMSTWSDCFSICAKYKYDAIAQWLLQQNPSIQFNYIDDFNYRSKLPLSAN